MHPGCRPRSRYVRVAVTLLLGLTMALSAAPAEAGPTSSDPGGPRSWSAPKDYQTSTFGGAHSDQQQPLSAPAPLPWEQGPHRGPGPLSNFRGIPLSRWRTAPV
ncbi:hypothetical protein GCM10009574_078070 [Streptomyces asiaticus]|uniref:Secreted protein n=2 Tax=Streptomyces rhizosphaericus TaxID=114699 RepID=A0ABN1SCG3_9ACTN